eukprot:352821-Chlamydomonas_euryale.AAC.9
MTEVRRHGRRLRPTTRAPSNRRATRSRPTTLVRQGIADEACRLGEFDKRRRLWCPQDCN